ncbi:uncharacterized protein LOC125370494 [Ricinus communis]|uniref:uncharacterized protein LOC125370494 n=1 Tax=Ricinus communis TaxID=3988 RepID=UPI00201B0EEE|nr:uncharacterized protein LOC125370494 [Ricinus communis]
MKTATLRNLSLYTRNLLLSPPKSITNSNSYFPLFVSLARSRLRFYSSESDSSGKPNFNHTHKPNGSVEDVDGVSDQEIKKRIEKFYQGDEGEIPAIFEAILKRKLAGISDDDGLMEALGPKVKDSDSDSDSDSNSSSDDDKRI